MKALLLIAGIVFTFAMTGCSDSSSTATLSPSAMRQANKVDRAVVASYRQVEVSDPSHGLGVAGGETVGSMIGSGNAGQATAAMTGLLIAGPLVPALQHTYADAPAYEYVLRKSNGDTVTLAQKQNEPYEVGQHVLIYYGVQARIVADEKYGLPKQKAKIVDAEDEKKS